MTKSIVTPQNLIRSKQRKRNFFIFCRHYAEIEYKQPNPVGVLAGVEDKGYTNKTVTFI